MILESLVSKSVPLIIYMLEAMGVFIIAVSAIKAFMKYALKLFDFSDHTIKIELERPWHWGLNLSLQGRSLKL